MSFRYTQKNKVYFKIKITGKQIFLLPIEALLFFVLYICSIINFLPDQVGRLQRAHIGDEPKMGSGKNRLFWLEDYLNTLKGKAKASIKG